MAPKTKYSKKPIIGDLVVLQDFLASEKYKDLVGVVINTWNSQEGTVSETFATVSWPTGVERDYYIHYLVVVS